MSTCMVGECTRPAVRNGPDGITRMCWGHLRLARLGQPLRELGAPRGGKHGRWSRSEHLKGAAVRYANAEDDEEYDLAWENLKDAARIFALGTDRGVKAARAALKRERPRTQ